MRNMPSQVWTDVGENWTCDILFGSASTTTSLWLRLFTDSGSPADADTLGDIAEVSGTSYSAIKYEHSTNWSVANSQATGDKNTFTANGESWGNVYGYFFATSDTGTGVIAEETFGDGPYNIGDGDKIEITPQITVS